MVVKENLIVIKHSSQPSRFGRDTHDIEDDSRVPPDRDLQQRLVPRTCSYSSYKASYIAAKDKNVPVTEVQMSRIMAVQCIIKPKLILWKRVSRARINENSLDPPL